MAAQSELGDLLRTKRDRLKPGALGLPARGRRRVPGLRREEVASLAGLSVDYLRRLEQGRVLPSGAVLDALSYVLRLDDVSRTHLDTLADRARGRQPRLPPDTSVRPTLLRTLSSLSPTPAVVLGRCCEVVAWNASGAALDPVVAAQPAEERNVARRVLLDPSAPDLYPEWEALAGEVADVLRLNAGRFPDDRELRELVDELHERSDAFRRHWARNEVVEKTFGRKLLDHPDVGRLELEYESFAVPATRGQALIVYTAEPGSATARRLELLAASTGRRSLGHYAILA